MKDKQTRIEVLQSQHRLLDEQIQIMFKRYAPDAELEALKLKKLRVKEEIFKLEKELDNVQ